MCEGLEARIFFFSVCDHKFSTFSFVLGLIGAQNAKNQHVPIVPMGIICSRNPSPSICVHGKVA